MRSSCSARSSGSSFSSSGSCSGTTRKPVGRQPVSATNERRADAAAGVIDRVRVHRWHHVLHHRRVPERTAPPPAPTPPRVHLGDRDLLDRGSVRLGDVRAVPGGHPAHAVVVADEHDLGRVAGIGADRLHPVLRAPGRDRRRVGKPVRARGSDGGDRSGSSASASPSASAGRCSSTGSSEPGSASSPTAASSRGSRCSRAPSTSTRCTTRSRWACR